MVRPLPKRKKERSRVAREVLEGLTELRELVRSGAPLSQKFTVRTVALVVEPLAMDSDQIKDVRRRLSASQSVFAAVLGVSVDAVQSWEQGRRPPSDAALRMLHIFRDHPELFAEQLRLKPAVAA